jgi:hypothetical protein
MNIQIIFEQNNSIFVLKNIDDSKSIKVKDLIKNILKTLPDNVYNVENSTPKDYLHKSFKNNSLNDQNKDKENLKNSHHGYCLYDQAIKLDPEQKINLNDKETKLKKDKTLYLIENKIYHSKKQEVEIVNKKFVKSKTNEKEKNDLSSPKIESIEELIMKVTGAKEKINKNRNVKKGRRIVDDDLGGEFDIFERILQSSQSDMNSMDRLNAIRNLLMSPLMSGMNSSNLNSNSNSDGNNGIGSNIINGNSNIIYSSVNSSRNPFYFPRRRQTTVQPDLTLINNLKEMGFEEDRISRALIATGNDITSATEMLLNGTDYDLEDDLPNGFVDFNQGAVNVNTSNNANLQVENGQGNIIDIDAGDGHDPHDHDHDDEILDEELDMDNFHEDPEENFEDDEAEENGEYDDNLDENLENFDSSDNHHSHHGHHDNSQNPNNL